MGCLVRLYLERKKEGIRNGMFMSLWREVRVGVGDLPAPPDCMASMISGVEVAVGYPAVT
jgi:hypothetical protein